MAVQRSSVLKELSALMCQLLVLVLCVGLVLMDTLGVHQSVMVGNNTINVIMVINKLLFLQILTSVG